MDGLNFLDVGYAETRHTGYSPSLTYEFHLFLGSHLCEQYLDAAVDRQRGVEVRTVYTGFVNRCSCGCDADGKFGERPGTCDDIGFDSDTYMRSVLGRERQDRIAFLCRDVEVNGSAEIHGVVCHIDLKCPLQLFGRSSLL